ncbi:hypothetical protein CPC16_006478 [Podila verticillata]|nr:hypothetical protein CPC16_006478 [Podila verticillata]
MSEFKIEDVYKRVFFGDRSARRAFGCLPDKKDLGAHDLTLVHFRLTNRIVTDMFDAFPNVHTLRLVDVHYESDAVSACRLIPANGRVKYLYLMRTNISHTLARALYHLKHIEIQADYAPWFAFPELPCIWVFDRALFEYFVGRLYHLESIVLHRVTLTGGSAAAVRSQSVTYVEMTPGMDIRGYFPANTRFCILYLRLDSVRGERPEFDVDNELRDRDDQVVDVTIRYYRMTCTQLAKMLERFPSVETLRLIDAPYKTDGVIPDQRQLKELILIRVKLKADDPTYAVPHPFTIKRHNDLEHFITNCKRLREVLFDRIVLEGETGAGILNDAVIQVYMTKEITQGMIKGYFAEHADFHTIKPQEKRLA